MGAPREEPFEGFHPAVVTWFSEDVGPPTPAQRGAWRARTEGGHLLVASPTGTGKTLAAVLPLLDTLVREAEAGALGPGVRGVIVTPLRALAEDHHRSLGRALAGIATRAPPASAVRVGLRTGDTPPGERRNQTTDPPHLLVTTPESLAIALAAPRLSRTLLRTSCVVIDEAHALAADKRGAALSLALERWEARCVAAGRPAFQRIGLSATVSPIREVAAWLGGARDVRIVEAPPGAQPMLEVRSPVPDFLTASAQAWEDGLYETVHELVDRHKTSLVFTATRRAAERVVHALRSRHGAAYVHDADAEASRDPAFPVADEEDDALLAPHHGSMARDARILVETRLSRGEMRCVVASASLELGIDVGSVEHVILVGSPRDVARALQRAGRSGHHPTGVRAATLVPLEPDDLLECAALAQRMCEGTLDPIRIPEAPLDVLAQHLAACALDGPIDAQEALDLARRAHAYRRLDMSRVQEVTAHLASRGLLRAAPEGFVRGPRLARHVYTTRAGVIPARRNVKVRAGARFVGDLEEAFVESLSGGDVFVLGGQTWRFLRSHGGTATVAPAAGVSPNVPAWRSEGLPLARGLAQATGALRDALWRGDPHHPLPLTGLAHGAPLFSDSSLTALAALGTAQREALDPARPGEIAVESSVDANGARLVIAHVALGRRVNAVLARAVCAAREEVGAQEAQPLVGDLAFGFRTPRAHAVTRGELSALARHDLDALLDGPVRALDAFQRRLWNVSARFDLADPLDPMRRAPEATGVVATEALAEVWHEALDLEGAHAFQARLRDGQSRFGRIVKVPAPSPLAAGLLVHAGGAHPSRERHAALRAHFVESQEARAFKPVAGR